jgi:hypothetical protein
MTAPFSIEHVFVDRIPTVRKERTLYVSVPFATAVHNCMCGCGTKIVTPLSPPQWKITFDGETVSLWPSVGNSGLACRSHYVIEHDQVHWAPTWSDEKIAAGRARDRSLRDRHFETAKAKAPAPAPAIDEKPKNAAPDKSWLGQLLDIFR